MCSYQLQKYRDAASYVLPVDANDTDTWGDKEHRLAQIAETTVIHKNVVEVSDTLRQDSYFEIRDVCNAPGLIEIFCY